MCAASAGRAGGSGGRLRHSVGLVADLCVVRGPSGRGERGRTARPPRRSAHRPGPLDSFETILKYLRTTRTSTGLRVRAHLVRKTYETGVKVTDAQMRELRITPNSVLPKWNYTIEPM